MEEESICQMRIFWGLMVEYLKEYIVRHIFSMFFILLSSHIHANFLDEVDLTGGNTERLEILDSVIEPSYRSILTNSQNETKMLFHIDHGDGTFSSIAAPDLEVNCKLQKASAKFSNKYFRIKNAYNFEISGVAHCNRTNVWYFRKGTKEGEVISIYNIAKKAVVKLTESGIIDFWKRQITIKWPSNGDYYNWNTVNVTKGYQWDVVGHELGHAIYDQAKLGRMGGGSHKIDQCYTKALALSEGWASYFSAWLSVSLTDKDAKFEYLVPRRAPIRFENIPSDVCAGQTNEWRVTGFLWDIIDQSNDGEESEITFANLFNLALKKSFSDTRKYAKDIVANGFDPILMNVVWRNNFLTDL